MARIKREFETLPNLFNEFEIVEQQIFATQPGNLKE